MRNKEKPFLSDSQAKELLNMLDEAGYSEFAVIIKHCYIQE